MHSPGSPAACPNHHRFSLSKRLIAVTAVVVLAAGCTSSTKPDKGSASGPGAGISSPSKDDLDKRSETDFESKYLAKDMPYVNDAKDPVKPPKGYRMIFIENIGRHGSRTDTSLKTTDEVLDRYDSAVKRNQVTDRGYYYPSDLKVYLDDEAEYGFGQLTSLGEEEWEGIGKRTAEAYAPFWKKVSEQDESIRLVATPIKRTQDSLEAFIDGLTDDLPDIKVGDPKLERRYINFKSSVSSAGEDALDEIYKRPEVQAAARELLGQLYTKPRVDGLKNPVKDALQLYLIYSGSFSMIQDTRIDFTPYVTTKSIKVLSSVRDAESFYKYGPGVSGEDNTFGGADFLLDNFFKSLDNRIAGGSTAAVFRVAHGETTMPFIAYLRIKGSEKQADRNAPFSYDNNPWRGQDMGRMAGNVEWVAYQNDADDVIVTIRLNEQPTTLVGCETLDGTKYFYDLDELKDCLKR